MPNNDLRTELDKMALEIVGDLQSRECSLDTKLDAFKVLSAYHLGLMKKGDKGPSTEETGRPTFKDLRSRIEAVK
jgi:hypothetical protein